ncbi:hypothetical protein E8E13_001005 [Curvularia kusanoi]|uniref:Uncharacterized protein n=1 Tax=Curvularia kusanoi TaxID=90978 RepID=A0A9P4W7W5_CURKU|nr:hypothetical protein E8E13_001005 [Curvularia kusanoi]
MSQVLILPKPLPSSSFALGQLLTDPLNSKSTSKNPVLKPMCNKPVTQSRYEDIVYQDEEGRFIPGFVNAETSLDNSVVLTADEMSLASLMDPSGAFEALRHDTETWAFLRKSALQRQPLYFVTGIKKLRNASYRNLPAKEGLTAEVNGRQTRLPMHVRRDSAELELEEEGDRDSVVAVEFMKVTCRVGPRDEPHTLEDIDYVWTYHTLDDPDTLLSVGFGKALQAKELRALAGIAINEDIQERGVYDHYFEDEGLAGF